LLRRIIAKDSANFQNCTMEARLLKEIRDLRALFEKEVVSKVKENQARVAKFEEERKKDSSQDKSIWHSMFDDDSDEESIQEDDCCVYEQDWANLGVEATLKENEAVKPAAHLQEPVPSQLDIHFTCLGPCGHRNLPRAAFSNEQVEDTLAVFEKMPKDVRRGEVNVQRFVSLVCKQCEEESLRQSKAAKPAQADAQEVRIEAASTHRPVGRSTGIAFGTVAKVLKKKGYAWIRRDDGGADLFAHFREFDGNEDWLNKGDRVQFAEMMDERKQRPKAMRWSLRGGAARGWSNRQQWWW